jgi:hypothetical protein
MGGGRGAAQGAMLVGGRAWVFGIGRANLNGTGKGGPGRARRW